MFDMIKLCWFLDFDLCKVYKNFTKNVVFLRGADDGTLHGMPGDVKVSHDQSHDMETSQKVVIRMWQIIVAPSE